MFAGETIKKWTSDQNEWANE